MAASSTATARRATAPALAQEPPNRRQRPVEGVELFVDRDPDRLEGPFRRVPAPEAVGGRDRGAYRLHQVGRGPVRPAADDFARDRPGVTLLTVLAERRGNPLWRPVVYDLGGGKIRVGIHAHVERRVICVREAALRSIELERRDAQVHVDEVGAQALAGQLGERVGEVCSHEPDLTLDLVLELLETPLGGGVAIDADEHAVHSQALGDEPCVSSTAEGAVDCGLTRARSSPGIRADRAPRPSPG